MASPLLLAFGCGASPRLQLLYSFAKPCMHALCDAQRQKQINVHFPNNGLTALSRNLFSQMAARIKRVHNATRYGMPLTVESDVDVAVRRHTANSPVGPNGPE